MDKEEVRQTAKECILLLKNIDFKQLGISQYNLEYIQRILPDLEYHFRIYTDAILILLRHEKTEPAYVVDFGGGHGFLSILLKKLGFKVIYCDNNPLSIKTVSVLTEQLDIKMDHIIEGSSSELHAYCAVNKIKPNYLIATDLIEHVYDLNAFFADLYQVNPGFKMVFTTKANPSDPFRVRNLRKVMVDIENSLFFPMRADFIRDNYPILTEEKILTLARLTRGLTYRDLSDEIDVYLETEKLPVVDVDKYNTCDPQTGSWMERLLPLKEYRTILKRNGFKAEFKRGCYNEKRRNAVASFTVKILNRYIKYSTYIGRIICAYLIIKVVPKN